MKKKTSNVVLVILAVFLLIFTSVCIWLFYKYQSIPDTLITCVFGICGTECGVLGWIKTAKTKYENSETEDVE